MPAPITLTDPLSSLGKPHQVYRAGVLLRMLYAVPGTLCFGAAVLFAVALVLESQRMDAPQRTLLTGIFAVFTVVFVGGSALFFGLLVFKYTPVFSVYADALVQSHRGQTTVFLLARDRGRV